MNNPTDIEEIAERVWHHLKAKGCSNPEKAVRVVMVEKHLLVGAVRAALAERNPQCVAAREVLPPDPQ